MEIIFLFHYQRSSLAISRSIFGLGWNNKRQRKRKTQRPSSSSHQLRHQSSIHLLQSKMLPSFSEVGSHFRISVNNFRVYISQLCSFFSLCMYTLSTHSYMVARSTCTITIKQNNHYKNRTKDEVEDKAKEKKVNKINRKIQIDAHTR